MDIKSFTHDKFSIDIKENTVFIDGVIDVPNPVELLTGFFRELHSHILDKKYKKVYVNVSKLSFINSSSIRELIVWASQLEEIEEDKKYLIIFLINPSVDWQKDTFSTIAMVYPENLNIEEIT